MPDNQNHLLSVKSLVYTILANHKLMVMKYLVVSCFILISILAFQTETYAQRNNRSLDTDEYFDESGSLRGRLWYGLGFTLPNFGSFGGQTSFSMGLAPMLGIKVFEGDDRFSVGPRASLQYAYFAFNNAENVQLLSYTIGGFARYKVFSQFFPHVEFEYENRAQRDFSTINGVERIPQQNFYVGAGYTSGGTIQYEILALYNLNEPDNSSFVPFDFRFAFTYNF